MDINLIIGKFVLVVVAAPFISGLTSKIKNNLRMRHGQPIFQPYYNLRKLFSKEAIIPENASWIFAAAPSIVLAAALCATLLLPFPEQIRSSNGVAALLTIIFILALGRFFQALAGLDAGSAFGGMGSSREMFVSSYVEPVACLAIFSLLLSSAHCSLSAILTGLAVLTVVLAETSRLPFDNQETHLELTMIHEAMVLDHSGPLLALIELAGYIRQSFWIVLLASILIPLNSFLALSSAVIILCFVIALIEIGIAKFRLFKVPDILMLGFVLALLAVAAGVMRI